MQRLTGPVQHYAWGSPTLIPELLGTEPDGRPHAELWLGAHPSAPARLESEGLDERVERDPAVVGAASVERFGRRLPYLLKLLAAAEPLSLQAHPTREQAERGWAREEAEGPARDAPDRNYKDDWPKPEMIVALTEFDALCGFADPARTAALWRELEVEALDPLVDALGTPDGLRAVLLDLLDDERWRGVAGLVTEAAGRRAEEEGAVGDLCRTAVEIARFYPGDPGVLVALLMNRVRLQPGEALFLGAGNLHAYLSGLGVEVMANSDNVLRGGLTPKHVDVAELGAVLDFSSITPQPVPLVDEGEGRFRFDTPAPEFTLWRVDCSDTPTTVPASTTGRIVLATSGRVQLQSGATAITLHRGQAAFLPAGETVSAHGGGTAFVAGPGVR
ncbi:mannose-6-phosphate isomerase, class I [Desertihabitans brevis]|uniref:mannose-6-phosphate isomerase n=1 Tax=Desertihabitans brevis TaxID=2268447 RepID=A0A367YRC9_9ACTN|nr:mannose-6-phosphate isomerase, class I [Desertihabitans brevis]RCK68378.1 mannose-6-phosphate isomerase, class I [Desertihabitans brevis]